MKVRPPTVSKPVFHRELRMQFQEQVSDRLFELCLQEMHWKKRYLNALQILEDYEQRTGIFDNYFEQRKVQEIYKRWDAHVDAIMHLRSIVWSDGSKGIVVQ
jgi:hypothetical protein